MEKNGKDFVNGKKELVDNRMNQVNLFDNKKKRDRKEIESR